MENINTIYKRYLEGTCSAEELGKLFIYFDVANDNELRELIDSELGSSNAEFEKSHFLKNIVNTNKEKLHNTLFHSDNHKKNARRTLMYKIATIAAILIITCGLFLYFQPINFKPNSHHSGQNILENQYAILKLSDGKKIILDKNNASVDLNGYAVKYADINLLNKNNVHNMILETPRGKDLKMRLSDGSIVWLNSESSLEFPSDFEGNNRKVKLKGEGYFEITKNKEKPFVVECDNQNIEVIGTSFNINTYKDNISTTTLVDGKIKVIIPNNDKTFYLEKDHQIVVKNNEGEVSKVNTSATIGWKDGYFKFKSTTIVEVLEQLERWYDLEIDYTRIPNDIRINAIIKKDKKLASVLYAIEEVSSLNFKIDGRRLEIVDKK
ncbi:FecR family protein [Sphingobacterium composti Ten et al. 2007 non Yoo et al. 2007]|uniref:FecR family protein n=1 Tax=Sphingobacterium composti TaxID=363260 RepID=UPI00135B67BE|nr:FecR family protein [Sphingobacterium composti Ten et al. 2007 non Yoo et al. 2007]